jgi:hypothetical protein
MKTVSNLEFHNNGEYVIRGLLQKCSEGNENLFDAFVIQTALEDIFHENWSILILEEGIIQIAGKVACLHYRNKVRAYGVSTTDKKTQVSAIAKFLKIEFGWSKIGDIIGAQRLAQAKIREKFQKKYKVLVFKLPSRKWKWNAAYGGIVEIDGFTFWFARVD